jgi:hypothetical protein
VISKRYTDQFAIKIIFKLDPERRVHVKRETEVLFVLYIILKRLKPFLMSDVKVKFFVRVPRSTNPDFQVSTGLECAPLTSRYLKFVNPNANGDTFVTVETARTKIIITKVTHPVRQ